MIGEPEMAEEPDGGGAPSDLLSSSDDADTATAAAAGGWMGRPWRWALGGVAVASAVWAAAVVGMSGTSPDLHGYHLGGGNPCSGGTLSPLKDALRVKGFMVPDATVSKGPALDKVSCVLTTEPPPGSTWVTTYIVTVSVELHKKTDPRAEFENAGHAQVSTVPGGIEGDDGGSSVAVAGTDDTSTADAAHVHAVSGVGDEAYVLAPRPSDQTLVVLHGGAVLTLQVNGYRQWNGPDESQPNPGNPPADPDLARLRPAMTTAMRHLMTSLTVSAPGGG